MEVDVAVVGGGPAGLSAAYAAARGGARVALFEKSKEIGYPIHTSGGSWIDELRALDIPERFMHPILEGHFVAPTETATFRYDTPASCVLDVRGLYQYLGELAASHGAGIFVNSSVGAPCMRNGKVDGVKVRRNGRRFDCHSKIVIDASGANSVLARALGLTAGFQRIGVGAEYDLHAPDWPEERAAFLFGSEVAPAGYAWVLPHGQRRVRTGVGIIRPDAMGDPREYLDRVCDNLRPQLGAFSSLEYHVGIIPSSGCLEQTVSDGFMVTGDAGGLISALLGEGIRFAIDIGRMAGRTAAGAIASKRHDREYLVRYEQEWQKKYAVTFKVGLEINERISQYSDEMWDEKIRQLRQLDPSYLPPLLKGDFSPKRILGMVNSSPGLVSAVFFSKLRSLFKSS